MCGAVATNIPRPPSLTFAGEKLLRGWSCFYSLGRTLMISSRGRNGEGRDPSIAFVLSNVHLFGFPGEQLMFMWANDLVMSTPFTDSFSPQVCPPTQMYPKPYTGTEGLDCSFPEALAHIEEKCHGQVRLNICLSKEKKPNSNFPSTCTGAVFNDSCARGVRRRSPRGRHLALLRRPLPGIPQVRGGGLQVQAHRVQVQGGLPLGLAQSHLQR